MVLIGKKERVQAHQDGDWHKAFHCWIIYKDINQDDYIIVQKRSSRKSTFPNKLDITAAGHYLAGETILDGIREVIEELGITVSFSSLIPLGVRIHTWIVNNTPNREFDDVFFLYCDIELSEYNFQEEEIAGLIVLKIDEAIEMCAGTKKIIYGRSVVIEEMHGENLKKEKILPITLNDFVPTIDAYFYKVLILAQRFLMGEKHLII